MLSRNVKVGALSAAAVCSENEASSGAGMNAPKKEATMSAGPRFDGVRRKRAVIFLSVCMALTAGVVSVSKSGSTSEDVYLNAGSGPIPPVYFGMHIHGAAANGAWPEIPFGAWRLSDAYVVWPDLEPQKGQWRFERLDKYVTSAEEHGVEVLLPLAHSPGWASARPEEPSAYRQPGWAAEPRNLVDWRAYVRQVARRYKGRVRYYEIWNEPNTKTLYSGGIQNLVDLTRVAREEIKAVDPSIVVISPSFVEKDGLKKLDQFLAKGGGRYVDVIGYHFYVIAEKPEGMLPVIARVRQIMEKHGVGAKPLWNTETGWLIANNHGTIDPTQVGFPRDTPVLTPEQATAYVARALILSWAAGVNRLYWYAWDNRAMGLVEEGGKTPKPAALAYRQIYRWLRGGTINSCRGSRAGIWTCQLTRYSGDRVWLVWTTAKAGRWTPPPDWRAVEWQGLDGRPMRIDAAEESVSIGPSPVLIRPTTLRRVSLP